LAQSIRSILSLAPFLRARYPSICVHTLYDVMIPKEGGGGQVHRVSEGDGMVAPRSRPWHLFGVFSCKIGVLPQTAEVVGGQVFLRVSDLESSRLVWWSLAMCGLPPHPLCWNDYCIPILEQYPCASAAAFSPIRAPSLRRRGAALSTPLGHWRPGVRHNGDPRSRGRRGGKISGGSVGIAGVRPRPPVLALGSPRAGAPRATPARACSGRASSTGDPSSPAQSKHYPAPQGDLILRCGRSGRCGA